MHFECTYKGELLNCSEEVITGTIIIPHCATGYKLVSRSSQSHIECQNDDTFSTDIRDYSCVPSNNLTHSLSCI